MKKVYVIFVLKEQNGEYQYKHRTIEVLTVDESKDIKEQINEFGEELAKGFYGNLTEIDGDTYYFNGGEVAVRYLSYLEIKEETYNEIRNIFFT
jgi:uroporphyrinogen-III decarboxylase